MLDRHSRRSRRLCKRVVSVCLQCSNTLRLATINADGVTRIGLLYRTWLTIMRNLAFRWRPYGTTGKPLFVHESSHRSRTDIDYMNQYRDFDNDAIRFNYSVGEQFLNSLHASGRHYVPIIDSAIYVPNPNNASDTYATRSESLKFESLHV